MYGFCCQMEECLAPVSSSEHQGLLIGFVTFLFTYLFGTTTSSLGALVVAVNS